MDKLKNMRSTDKTINWETFKIKFHERENVQFERLASLLFHAETGNRIGLFRFKNNPGIETDPVSHDGKLTGFQAKYYTTTLSANKEDIIDSIRKAKAAYPDLEAIYLYTNREPGFNTKSGDLKPAYIKEIENSAAASGISLVWRLSSHLEVQLALPENEYIYDIFFSEDNSADKFIDTLGNHNDLLLSPIRETLMLRDTEITVNRDKLYGEINASLDRTGITVISGEGGSGKSALLKRLYRDNSSRYPIYIFRASELNSMASGILFPQDGGNDFHRIASLHPEEKKKVTVIDSAERLAEIERMDMVMDLLNDLKRHGWTILLITRTVYLSDICGFIQDFIGSDFRVIDIPPLEKEELENFAAQHRIKLPDNSRFRTRLTNLFYLGEYCCHYQDIDRRGNYRAFIDFLWTKRIQGSVKNGMLHLERDNFLVEVAVKRAVEGAFYLPYPFAPSAALSSLVTDEIIGFDQSSNSIFITHDIYEEWALTKHVDRRWKTSADITDFLSGLADTLPIRRAFRLWLTEEMSSGENDRHPLADYYFKEGNANKEWGDEILTSILLSPCSRSFFDKYSEEIAADGYEVLKRIFFLLRIACVCPGGNHPGLDKPIRSGWEAAISYIYEYCPDFFKTHPAIVLPVLKQWTLSISNGETTRIAGRLVADEIIKSVESGDNVSHTLFDSCLDILFNSAPEIKDSLQHLAELMVASTSKTRSVTNEHIWEKLLTEPYRGTRVIETLPDAVLAVCGKLWKEEYEEEEEVDEPWYFRSNHKNKFGLSMFGEHNCFPSSANQTPLLHLLHVKPIPSITFIIEFVNYSVSAYAERDNDSDLREVEVALPDRKIKQWFSPGLWACYRGYDTHGIPDLIKSAHMALEKYLLHIFDAIDSDSINAILLNIISRSRSASLSAVVASVVAKHPGRLTDIAMILFSCPEFIEADCLRLHHESQIKSLYRLGYGLNRLKDILYADERIATCKEPHRGISLELLITKYQIERFSGIDEEARKQLVKDIHALIDRFKSDKALMDSMSNIIERIDSRNLKMSIVREEGDIAFVQLEPIQRSEKSLEASRQAAKDLEDVTRFSSLDMWAKDYRPYAATSPSIDEYNKKPDKALKEFQDLIRLVSEGDPITVNMYGTLPPIVASKLLRTHHRELSAEMKALCRDIVLECFSRIFDEAYHHQVDDGVKASALALPCLIDIYPELTEDVVGSMVASMLRVPDAHHWRTLYKDMPEALMASGIWHSRPDVAETVVASYLELQQIVYDHPDQFTDFIKDFNPMEKRLPETAPDCTHIYTLETLLRILPYDTRDQRLLDFYTSIAGNLPVKLFVDGHFHGHGNGDPYSSSAYIDVRSNIFQALAVHLLHRPTGREPDPMLEAISEKLVCSDHTASFLERVVAAEDCLVQPEMFEKIWFGFYDKIKSFHANGDHHDFDKILINYTLAWRYWKEDARDWHSMSAKIVQLHEKLARDMWDCDILLYCFGKVYTSIGIKYIEHGIDIMAEVVKKRVEAGKTGIPSEALYYLERFMKSYSLGHWDKIKKDRKIRKKVLAVLTYMVENGSAFAYRQRDLI